MKGFSLRKSPLFRRLLLAFLAGLLLTVLVLSMLMVALVRGERTRALEAEVLVQARDVAKLMQQYDSLTYWNGSEAISQTLRWKMEEIRDAYGATVWLVDGSRRVLVLGGSDNAQRQLSDPDVVARIYEVLSGKEIRVTGLTEELGQNMVTIGVPWISAYGYIAGAVLLHISTEDLAVDYSDLIRYAMIASGAALVLGVTLTYFVARRQSRRISAISDAAHSFTVGDLSARIRVDGNDEVAHLAETFNRMAEELSRLEESRRDFVASVSHELRSPLTSIRGYVEGILDGVIPPDDQSRYLQVALSETKRLTKLVNELLDLSRIESGNVPLNRTVFDVNALFAEHLVQFEQRIEERHVRVEADFQSDRLYVSADRDRISQVVANLLDNAVKFVDDGGLLTVRTRGSGKSAELSVENTGEMIPPEKLDRIFDRFYKVETAHTAGRGSGLGLAICKRIVEQHGQKLEADSGVWGTRFTFQLDLAPAPSVKGAPGNQERGAS